MWAETGVVGLLLYLVLHASLVVALLRRARAGHWAAGGALLSWVGFQVLGLAHFLPFHPSVALAFAFVWGVGLVHPGLGSVPVAAQSPGEAQGDAEGAASRGAIGAQSSAAR